MYPAVIFPDVIELETTYLRAALAARSETFTDSVHVSNQLPNAAPARSVIILPAGGRRLGPVTQLQRLLVNVRTTKPKQTTDLARMTLALLMNQPSGVVKHVDHIGGPVDVEDVMPHLLLTVELTVVGSELA